MSVDPDHKILVSKSLKIKNPPVMHKTGLVDFEGRSLRLPHRFVPDQETLTFHREKVYLS